MATILRPEIFIEEVKKWGVTDKLLHHVRMMKKGDNVYFRFYVPHTTEIIETIVKEEDYYEYSFDELSQISVPAVWDDKEINLLKNVVTKLEEINVKSAFTENNIGNNLQLERESTSG